MLVYAPADVLLLPSVNECIALILYEAMASGLVVVATDIRGQRELFILLRGFLLQPATTETVTEQVVAATGDIIDHPAGYDRVRATAQRDVERLFNVGKFQKCVLDLLTMLRTPVEYVVDPVLASVLSSTRDA